MVAADFSFFASTLVRELIFMRQRLFYASLGALLFAGAAFAQQNNSTPPPDAPQPSQQQSPPPANAQSPPPDNTQSQPQHKKSAAEENPFPEAESAKAADKANGGDATPPADSSKPAPPDNGAPATGYKDYSSSRDHLKGLDLPGDNEARTDDGAGGTIVNPKLAAEDTRVGGFYLHTGDFKGAYSRYLEATRVDPGNADAVFGLAEAARGLDRRKEAITNYTLYLEALPDGSKAKDARKALKELAASAPK
jgi:tetratricopeptide (TPR) repeat protein